MRIWLVSELYYPEDHATGHFLTQIAEGLARHHDVGVFCCQPTYWKRGLRAPRDETRNGVTIRRCAGAPLDGGTLISRLVNLVTITLSLTLRVALHIDRGDHLLIVSNPPSLPWLVAAACRLRGSTYSLLVHDVYPEVLVASGLASSKSAIVRFLKWLDVRIQRSASRIIVLGRDMERLVRRRIGRPQPVAVLIPHWGDESVRPLEREKSRVLSRLGLEDRFVVQYAGNMGRINGLGDVLDAAVMLRGDQRTHFLLIGSGAKRRWVDDTVRKAALENVTVLDHCPREDLAEHLAACDVAVVSLVAGATGVSVPSRLYNIMAAGRPIIAVVPSDSEVAQVVREERIGWVVPPEAPAMLVAAVQEARARPQDLRSMASRARQAAEAKYTFEGAIAAYLSLIAGLEPDGRSD